MQTYKRYYQGHSFSLDNKNKEVMVPFLLKLPSSMSLYLSYISGEMGLTKQKLILRAIGEFIIKNDLSIIEKIGYDDSLNTYESVDYKLLDQKDWQQNFIK